VLFACFSSFAVSVLFSSLKNFSLSSCVDDNRKKRNRKTVNSKS